MKRLISAFIISLSFASFGLTEDIPLDIQDLQGGEVNQYDAMLIPDNSVAEARNVLFDDVSMVKKRHGMSKINTSAIGDSGPVYNQFEFKKSNGTTYHIAVASNTLYYRTSGVSFTAFKASVSTSTSITNFAVFMDTLQFCNGSDNLQYWNTSSVATTTTAYQPKYLLAWQNRLWIAGDIDEPTALRSSKYLDPSTWTIPASNAVATDPVLFDINSQDGQDIIGIKESPNGSLLILKNKSCYELDGTDRNDFFLRLVSPDIGCVDSGSYTFQEGRAMWLSSEGFVEYDGNSLKIVSRPIQGTVDSILQSQQSQGSFNKNSSDEWAIFSSTSFLDMSSNPGSIRNKTFTSNANYTSGTFSGRIAMRGGVIYSLRSYTSAGLYCDIFTDGVQTSHNLIKAPGTTYPPEFPSYDDRTLRMDSSGKIHITYFYGPTSSSTDWQVWYSSSTDGVTWSNVMVSTVTGSIDLFDGSLSLSLDSSNSPHIIFSNYPGSFANIKYNYYGVSGWTNGNTLGSTSKNYVNFTLLLASNNHLKVVGTEGTNNYLFSADASSGSVATSSWAETNTTFSGAGTSFSRAAIDSSDHLFTCKLSITPRMFTNYSGAWSSTTVNGYCIDNLEAGSDGVIRFRGYNGADNIYFGRYYPTTGASIGNRIPTSIGSEPPVTDTNLRYYLFLDNGNLPILGAYSTSGSQTSPNESRFYTSTGTYISDIWDTGMISGLVFDLFSTQESAGAFNIGHYLRSATTSAGIASTSWNSVTKNTIPSISASRYIQYKVEFSTNVVSGNVPSLDEANIAYHSSSGSGRLSSIYYNHRIYNAVSISSSTVLDRQIIYDKNHAWTEFTTALNCMSLLNFKGTPYCGSNVGFIYQMDTGDNDDGSPIDAYIKTKAYALGIVFYKNLSKLFLVADDSGNWNLNLGYYLDRNNSANESFAIDLDQTSGIINYKVPLTKNTPFSNIQFKVYNSQADQPFDLYGLYGYYRLQPLR